MSDLTTADAKRDFQRGLLRGVEIERSPMNDTWELKILDQSTGDWGYLLAAHPREVRRFRTLDAVISAAEQIGFRIRSLKC